MQPMQEFSRRLTLDMRAIDRLIQENPDLEDEELRMLVEDIDLNGVKLFIEKAKSKDLRDMSWRQLVFLCRKHHIPNYSRMDKEEMCARLAEITRYGQAPINSGRNQADLPGQIDDSKVH
jgi:hypothetical protein